MTDLIDKMNKAIARDGDRSVAQRVGERAYCIHGRMVSLAVARRWWKEIGECPRTPTESIGLIIRLINEEKTSAST